MKVFGSFHYGPAKKDISGIVLSAFHCLCRGRTKKTGSIMRISVILSLGVAMHLSAAAFSQKVSLSTKDAPLESVFNMITEQTGLHFVYNDELIEHSGTVTLDVKNAALVDVLNQCLGSKGLSFIIRYNTIVIRSVAQPQAMNAPPPPIIVSGFIKNTRNEPLEGASVVIIVNGQRLGKATDAKGFFQFNDVPDRHFLLKISMIGYAPISSDMQIKGDGKVVLNFTLRDSVAGIKEEIVVNGIYQRPTQNYTGAAQSYSSEQLKQVSNTSVLSALKALDPSFQMPSDINFGSDPNHLPQLQLRGSNSIANTSLTSQYGYISNPPLFILDGFEVPLEKIFDLDMGRVKRVTLLKDAAATSIYGSRAANGVLVIESVQPQKGRLRLSYSNNIAVTAPDLTGYNLLNAAQKIQFEKMAGVYTAPSYQGPPQQQGLNELYNQRLAEVQRGVNTYWLSQPLTTAVNQRHSIYLDGGDDYMRYGVDLSYNGNTGVMKGSKRQNYSGGINLTYHKDKLQFNNYVSVSYNNSVNSPYGSFSQYATLNPYWRPRDSTGHVAQTLQAVDDAAGVYSAVYNPMYDATLNTLNNANYLNVTEHFQADWNILKELKASARFSMYTQKFGGNVFLPAQATEFMSVPDSLFSTRGYYQQTTGNQDHYEGDVFLNYGKTMGRNTIFATAGAHIQQDQLDSNTVTVQGFPNANMANILYGLQYPVNSTPTGAESISRLAGYYANASYAYDNRYLLDVSYRTDGSSQFGTNKHYAPFWSVGGGWNLHKEKFIELPDLISKFKLRASYGSTGAQNFPAYASLQTYTYMQGTRYLDNVGSSLMALGNPNLQWQQTNKLNLGTDIELGKGRVLATFNYYVETTNNLFTQINTVPSTGFNSFYANLGNVQNKGIELYLTAFVVKNEREGIFWSFYANLLHNENKLIKISTALSEQNDAAQAQQTSGAVTSPVLLYKEGQSMSAIYAVRSLGIDPSTGNEIFLTKSGQQTYLWNPEDEVVVGDNQPKINGTFGTNVLYKGISLNISMRTELGGDMYNYTLANMVENASVYNNVDIRAMTERWTKPGDIAEFKGLTDINGITRTDVTNATSRFVEKNNTLYCDAINFGYMLPYRMLKKLKVSRVQANFYINSPFVVSSIKQERGLAYPFARTNSFALQIGF